MGTFIICPELEDYRTYLEERRQKQSKGGKVGSAITNEIRYKSIKTDSNNISSISSTPSSTFQLPPRGSVESLVQSSTDKQSQVQSSKEKDSSADIFVKEMEEYEASENNANDMVEF